MKLLARQNLVVKRESGSKVQLLNQIMKEDAFRSWLLNNRRNSHGISLNVRTVGWRLSNCRTVERYEGDLDLQFDGDRLSGLLERLRYSTEDERLNRSARYSIPIDGMFARALRR